jgi:hypothetical protein
VVREASTAREPVGDSLIMSLPLLFATLALFLGGYFTWATAPTVGPRGFPLWDLLVVLGFISGVGTILSVLYWDSPAPSGTEPAPVDRAPLDSSDRRDFGRPRPSAEPATPAAPSGGLAVAIASLGSRPSARPAPTPDWSEDDLPILVPPPRRPVPNAPSFVPPASRTPASGNSAVENALAELDEIQRAATPRRTGDRAASP